MTIYVADIDNRGLSGIVSMTELPHAPAEVGTDVVELFAYVADSADSKIGLAGRGVLLRSGVAPAAMVWRVSRMPPGWQFPDMHRVRTVDVHAVLSGSLALRLDDGEHELVAGDFLVLNGVDHGWRAGPAGATLSTVQLGIAG